MGEETKDIWWLAALGKHADSRELKGMLESSQRATELMRKSGMRPPSPVSVPLGQCVLEKDVSLSLWVQFSDSSTF